jgi:integrase
MREEVTKRRKAAGDGHVGSYRLASGETRYFYKFSRVNADGSRSQVLARRDEHGDPFLAKAAAGKAMRAAQVKADEGRHVSPSHQKLGDFLLGTWLPARKGLADSTRRAYEYRFCKFVLPRLGTVELGKMTSAMVARLFADLERDGVGPGTLGAVKSPLNAAFNWALRQHPPLVKFNPVTAVELPDPAQELAEDEAEARKVWTWDEAAAFLAWADEGDSERAAMWRLAFATGMRRGELLGLQWKDVDFEYGTLNLRRQLRPGPGGRGELAVLKSSAKSGKPSRRIVVRNEDEPLLDAESALRSWKKHRGSFDLRLVQPEAFVFGDLDGHHARWPNDLTRQWHAAVAGYRKSPGALSPAEISLHGTRHSNATWLLTEGMSVKVLAERLGNTPAVLMRTYSHLLEGAQEDQFRRVGQARRERSIRTA